MLVARLGVGVTAAVGLRPVGSRGCAEGMEVRWQAQASSPRSRNVDAAEKSRAHAVPSRGRMPTGVRRNAGPAVRRPRMAMPSELCYPVAPSDWTVR